MQSAGDERAIWLQCCLVSQERKTNGKKLQEESVPAHKHLGAPAESTTAKETKMKVFWRTREIETNDYNCVHFSS